MEQAKDPRLLFSGAAVWGLNTNGHSVCCREISDDLSA